MTAAHQEPEEAGPYDELLAAITADVDTRLARSEERNAGLVNELAEAFGNSDAQVRGKVGELIGKVDETQQVVSSLHDLVTDLPAGGPWLWAELDPKAQRDLWIELDAFVSWLQNRILSHNTSRQSGIAPCWYKHPDAVEQLTALMVAHKASYNPKTKKASHALVDWFHRALWPTMEVIKARGTFKNCIEKREHKDVEPAGQFAAGSEEFSAFLDETAPAPVEAEEPKSAPGAPAESSGQDGEGPPPWLVDQATGEISEPPEMDEPPEPEEGRS